MYCLKKFQCYGSLLMEGKVTNFTEFVGATFFLTHTDLRGHIPGGHIYSMYLFYACTHTGDG